MANNIIYVNHDYEVDPSYEVTSRYIHFAQQFNIKNNIKNDRIIKTNSSNSQTKAIKDNKNKITWSIPKNIEFSIRSDDTYYVVEKSFEGRPDKIAMKFYGNPRLDWAFLYANNIQEPIQELITGMVLRIPNFEQVQLKLM